MARPSASHTSDKEAATVTEPIPTDPGTGRPGCGAQPETPEAFRGHPCFDAKARHTSARVHLPVAPKCNVQCNFCNRKYDCANESRPGVTSVVLSPGQALKYTDGVVERMPNTTVVGIAGPGDPMANPVETLDTLRRVRERYPDMHLCLATNGLNLPEHVDELIELGVSHVTVTVNAVDPAIGAKIYGWVRDKKVIYRGEAAAKLLLERQMEAIRRLSDAGVTVKINCIVIPGVNENHVGDVARKVADAGAKLFNCMPLHPTADTVFAALPEPDKTTMSRVRHQAETWLPQMSHCRRCRADAAGMLGDEMTGSDFGHLVSASRLPVEPDQDRPYVAVASMEGVLVNQHLGEASRFLIYARGEGGFELVETRPAPDKGGGMERWRKLAELIKDCRALLVLAAGDVPKGVLTFDGVRVVEMNGLIEEGLDAVYGEREPVSLVRRKTACHGGGCGGGSGLGC
jgi:nitrogen fixation protein NifB